MNDLANNPSDLIPTLDIGPYLAGEPDALRLLSDELCDAMENVGFYILINHGISMSQIEETLDAIKRFHALPLETKTALKGNEHNIGYMAVNSSVSRASQVDAEGTNRPNFVEAFFVKRDLPPDHPDVRANKLYRPANLWPAPETLPGFRETVVSYCRAMEQLAQKMLPAYALALDLPEDFFSEPFAEANVFIPDVALSTIRIGRCRSIWRRCPYGLKLSDDAAARRPAGPSGQAAGP